MGMAEQGEGVVNWRGRIVEHVDQVGLKDI